VNALLQACVFTIERLMRLTAPKKCSFPFVWDSADRDTDILDNIYTLSILSTVACPPPPPPQYHCKIPVFIIKMPTKVNGQKKLRIIEYWHGHDLDLLSLGLNEKSRSRIHEYTISLRLLGIILRVLRLEVSMNSKEENP
jgi:hypothetical protein